MNNYYLVPAHFIELTQSETVKKLRQSGALTLITENDFSFLDVEVLTAALRVKGYHVASLWHIEDVKTAIAEYNEEHETDFVMTEAEMQNVLGEVLEDSSDTNNSISHKVSEYFIKKGC